MSLTFSSLSEPELFNVEPKPSSSFSKLMNEPSEPNCRAYIEPNIYHINCNLKKIIFIEYTKIKNNTVFNTINTNLCHINFKLVKL